MSPSPGPLAWTGHRAAGAGLARAQGVSMQMKGGRSMSAPGKRFRCIAPLVSKATL